ncbi:integrin alpha-PS4 isoform X1 [Leptinotarsa decemlineata]|uniref:integrin alpha-PS4 isoform X1 n=1 Tax=Leptinotarsa decemlineata TaxID=7539 RepID=UPI003D30CC6F
MELLIFLFLDILCVSCLNFDINTVKEFSLSDGVPNTYFGYSLLLQKGSNPIRVDDGWHFLNFRVIVGAPKNDKRSGGAVYACDAMNSEGCHKYNITTSNWGTKNGNFLGAALDGDETKGQSFIVCAPRKMTAHGIPKRNYYLKGFCAYQRNSSKLTDIVYNLQPLKTRGNVIEANGTVYYNNAFGQAGLDVHYVQELGRAFLGAPGIKNWNGALVSQSLSKPEDSTIIPQNSDIYDRMDLLGYSVASMRVGKEIYSIGGAPRANHLLGMVGIYKNYKEFKTFYGDEVGSYFGSSVLSQDVNNDGEEDLFIGAPMGKGSTFEEGYVYVFENAGRNTAKLVGSKKTGARFGTAVAALGDIDLDSFNDIAVSAPFEDDGTGAVYIYMGSRLGIITSFAQRLTPEQFNGNSVNVKGFGVGLSKGNDIDGSGHNDLAIGAFKTGNVFILRTKSVVDYKMSLHSNVTTLKINDANNMKVKYCVYYSQRSKVKDLKTIDFNLTIALDYRVKGQRIHVRTIEASLEKLSCGTIDILTEPSPALTPFTISMIPQLSDSVFGVGENKIEKSIVFSHGCGDDQICQTRISLDLTPDKSSIVLGLDKQVQVSLTVKNKGEPGYQCQLLLQVPDEVEYRREKECNSENSTLACSFSTTLINEKKFHLVFDIISDHPSAENIIIGFDVECTGENLEPNSAKNATIAIVEENSPYIEGKTETPNVYYDDETNIIETSHSFVVGNSGPSPFKMKVHLLMPMVQMDGVDIFEVVETKATSQGVQFFCKSDRQTEVFNNINNLESDVPTSLNKTIVLDCLQEGSNCLEIKCEGEYLYPSELAKINVKVTTKTKLLDAHYHEQLQMMDGIGYLVTGFIPNAKRIQSSSMVLIIPSQRTKPVPLWVWIVAALLGFIVLFVLTFLLYKCHFFDRIYKEKMNDEKLIEEEMNGNAEPLEIIDECLEDTAEETPENTHDESQHR